MNRQIVKINKQGELLNPSLLKDIREKYTPDSPFLQGAVPYVIMALCGIIDSCFFYSLFSMISYDRPLLLWVQIAGFVFGFDCLPVFAGIHYKKLKQGLTRDKFTFRLALIICALICAANIGLRAATVDILSPDLSESSQFSFADTEEVIVEEDTETDAVAWMVAITGMIVPIVTSVGSFYISNLCYDPLLYRKYQEERMIRRKEDQIRRLEAINQAYKTNQDLMQTMLKEDEQQYAAARAMTVGLLLEYHNYIRHQMTAYPGNFSSTNLESLPADKENLLQDLEQLCIRNNLPVPVPGTGE